MELVRIGNRNVELLKYKSIPVVTMRMIDELHERPEGTAKRNFKENRARFIEGDDFFNVPYNQWSAVLGDNLTGRNSSRQDEECSTSGGYRGEMIFFTEPGYLMLVKSFTDDLAWKIQRELVKNYFSKKGKKREPDELTELAKTVRTFSVFKKMALESGYRGNAALRFANDRINDRLKPFSFLTKHQQKKSDVILSVYRQNEADLKEQFWHLFQDDPERQVPGGNGHIIHNVETMIVKG